MATNDVIYCPVCDEHKSQWRHLKNPEIRMRIHLDTHRKKQRFMLQTLSKSLQTYAQQLQDELLGPHDKLRETYQILQGIEYEIRCWKAIPEVPKFHMYLHRTRMPDCKYITYQHLPFPQSPDTIIP